MALPRADRMPLGSRGKQLVCTFWKASIKGHYCRVGKEQTQKLFLNEKWEIWNEKRAVSLHQRSAGVTFLRSLDIINVEVAILIA